VLIDIEDACHGATRAITLQSPVLDETGHVTTRSRTLNVKIPKGIREGQQIRLAGQGGTAPGGGSAGDLYLQIEFRPHRLYRVDGRDLSFDLPVAPWEAALGARVKVPTPDGTVDLKIPAGAKSGNKLRLKGRGIPGQPPGDIYAVLQIVVPKASTEKQRSLYRQLQQAHDFNPRAALGV
jgi:curved DNA-binding protein